MPRLFQVPKQRNRRDENEAIKAGRDATGVANDPAKLRQKDGRTLDGEERTELLRLQEPHQRRPGAQTHPGLSGDARECA